MSRFVRIVSIILLAMGALWTLQGAGLIGGSFMTGSSQWFYIGRATAAVGLLGCILSFSQTP